MRKEARFACVSDAYTTNLEKTFTKPTKSKGGKMKKRARKCKEKTRPFDGPKYVADLSDPNKASFIKPQETWQEVAKIKVHLSERLSTLLMDKPYNIVPPNGSVTMKNMYEKSHSAALKLGLFGELPAHIVIGSDQKFHTRDKLLLEKSFASWNAECRVPTILRNLAHLEEQIGGEKSLDTLTDIVVAARLVADHPTLEKERKRVLKIIFKMQPNGRKEDE